MKPVKKVLVALDMSQHSPGTLECAAYWARAVGASMVVVSVINQRDVDAIETASRYVDVPPVEAYVAKLTQERNEAIDQCVSQSECRGLPLERLVRVGVPANEILKAVGETGCDLVVIGSLGRGHVSGALFGSTAQKVVRRSPVQVLVVPAAAQA
ncbi:MAG: universal stress protein [Desulfarculus sp.]|nr:MAG: universal stress protein [Desulfarculus sp.]